MPFGSEPRDSIPEATKMSREEETTSEKSSPTAQSSIELPNQNSSNSDSSKDGGAETTPSSPFKTPEEEMLNKIQTMSGYKLSRVVLDQHGKYVVTTSTTSSTTTSTAVKSSESPIKNPAQPSTSDFLTFSERWQLRLDLHKLTRDDHETIFKIISDMEPNNYKIKSNNLDLFLKILHIPTLRAIQMKIKECLSNNKPTDEKK